MQPGTEREYNHVWFFGGGFMVYGTSIPFTSGNKTNQQLICTLHTTANTKIFILMKSNMKHDNWLG